MNLSATFLKSVFEDLWNTSHPAAAVPANAPQLVSKLYKGLFSFGVSVRTKIAIRDGDSSKVEKFFTGLKKAYGAKWSWDKILEEPQQYTPLHVAAQCGKVEICKMLLENDCDINAKDIDGFDQLFFCEK